MSPQHRGRPDPDFNDQLEAALAAWKVAWDAIHPLETSYRWASAEESQLKKVKSAKRFMMSARSSLKKLAIERANAGPTTPAEWLRSIDKA